MSWREHWKEVRSSVVDGDVISACRDNESRTYRLFANKGWEDVKVGKGMGFRFDSAECCDLSIEDLRSLVEMLNTVIAEHKPWPPMDES